MQATRFTAANYVRARERGKMANVWEMSRVTIGKTDGGGRMGKRTRGSEGEGEKWKGRER